MSIFNLHFIHIINLNEIRNFQLIKIKLNRYDEMGDLF